MSPGAALVLSSGGALAAGAVLGWLLARVRHGRELAEAARRAEGELAELRTRLEERDRRIGDVETELQHEREAVARLQAAVAERREAQARLEADLEAERRASAEKLEVLAEAEKKFREVFAALSAETLRQNSQSFLDLAKATLGEFQTGARSELERREQAIGEMVKPLRDSLGKVEEVLRALESKREGAYAALREQVKLLGETQRDLQTETARLVRALRTPVVRGRWGEMQLRRVVELAGMEAHCDFVEQKTLAGGDSRLRPDMLVHLPGGKTVVIDAKVPVAAYLDALEIEDEEAREEKLREHARQLREHMIQLGSKDYTEHLAEAPDFVVMFLPVEALLSAALRYDPSLIDFGADRNVIPASPTTLIALLRAVAYGWQQEKIAASAREVSERGRELYHRLQVFANHFEGIRKGLEITIRSYNQAVGSLERRVLAAARRFRELGAARGPEIPELQAVEETPRLPQLPADVEPAGALQDAGEDGPAEGS